MWQFIAGLFLGKLLFSNSKKKELEEYMTGEQLETWNSYSEEKKEELRKQIKKELENSRISFFSGPTGPSGNTGPSGPTNG